MDRSTADFDEMMSILVDFHVLNCPEGQAMTGIEYVKMVAHSNKDMK